MLVTDLKKLREFAKAGLGASHVAEPTAAIIISPARCRPIMVLAVSFMIENIGY